jgi:phage tail-like protein
VKFTECNGIEWSVETESFFEGGNNRNKVHLIGQGSFKPLVLKKGFYSNNGEFFNWLKTQQDSGSSIGRTNIALVVSDDAQNEVCRFQFFNAFCSRYQGPSFNAKQSEIAFEEVEIIYDWFEMKPGDAFTQMLGTVVGALL